MFSVFRCFRQENSRSLYYVSPFPGRSEDLLLALLPLHQRGGARGLRVPHQHHHGGAAGRGLAGGGLLLRLRLRGRQHAPSIRMGTGLQSWDRNRGKNRSQPTAMGGSKFNRRGQPVLVHVSTQGKPSWCRFLEPPDHTKRVSTAWESTARGWISGFLFHFETTKQWYLLQRCKPFQVASFQRFR